MLDLDSTASRSRHGSLLCLDPQAQAIRVSPNQVCAHQAFACRNRSHRRASRPPARKTQKSGQPKASHAPLLASESLSRAASNSSLPDRLLGTRAALKALLSTDLLGLRIWWSYNVARASTCHLGFRHLLHAPVNMHAPPTRRNQLLMSSDVT